MSDNFEFKTQLPAREDFPLKTGGKLTLPRASSDDANTMEGWSCDEFV